MPPIDVDLLLDPLVLEQSQETFLDRAVVAIAAPTHARHQSPRFQKVLPVVVAELAVLTRVQQPLVGHAPQLHIQAPDLVGLAVALGALLHRNAVIFDPSLETVGADTNPYGHLGDWMFPVGHLRERSDFEPFVAALRLLRFHQYFRNASL